MKYKNWLVQSSINESEINYTTKLVKQVTNKDNVRLISQQRKLAKYDLTSEFHNKNLWPCRPLYDANKL